MSKTGVLFRRDPELVVHNVTRDLFHVVPFRPGGAQHLYPALGWRLRSHHGWRVRPPEVARQGSLRGRHATRGATHI